ncbi:MAG: hypothetical protein R2731_10555 [Nocardioides sp.]
MPDRVSEPRFRRTLADHAEAIDRQQRAANLGIVVILGVLAAGVFLAAAVGRSPGGFLAGLVAAGSPWAWWRAERHRTVLVGPEHRRALVRELAWTLASAVLLVAGWALLLTALTHGW